MYQIFITLIYQSCIFLIIQSEHLTQVTKDRLIQLSNPLQWDCRRFWDCMGRYDERNSHTTETKIQLFGQRNSLSWEP